MLYDYELVIPSLTLSTAPVSAEVIVGPGRIVRVEIQFPTGCGGLVHVRVKRWGHQLWPTNPDNWMASHGWIVTWDDDVDVSQPPLTVLIEGYNEDDTFQHVITFRFITVAPVSGAPSWEESEVGQAVLAAIAGAGA